MDQEHCAESLQPCDDRTLLCVLLCVLRHLFLLQMVTELPFSSSILSRIPSVSRMRRSLERPCWALGLLLALITAASSPLELPRQPGGSGAAVQRRAEGADSVPAPTGRAAGAGLHPLPAAPAAAAGLRRLLQAPAPAPGGLLAALQNITTNLSSGGGNATNGAASPSPQPGAGAPGSPAPPAGGSAHPLVPLAAARSLRQPS